ncbi:MAG TPA: hypothetical protein VF086_22400 [Propionibacteriaceae bacterium]
MTLKSSLESDADTSMVKPDGPAVAALLALGIGAAVLGFLTTLAAASTTVNGWLALNSAVGPLSGKTMFAVVVWLATWAVLHPILRMRARLTTGVLITTGVLLFLGLLGTFPPFFEAFAAE